MKILKNDDECVYSDIVEDRKSGQRAKISDVLESEILLKDIFNLEQVNLLNVNDFTLKHIQNVLFCILRSVYQYLCLDTNWCNNICCRYYQMVAQI